MITIDSHAESDLARIAEEWVAEEVDAAMANKDSKATEHALAKAYRCGVLHERSRSKSRDSGERPASNSQKEVTHGAPSESSDRGETTAGATLERSHARRPAEVPFDGRGVDAAGNAPARGDGHVERDGGERPAPSYPDALDADGRRAPYEIRAHCWKVAEQAGKGNWFNVLEYVGLLGKLVRVELRKALAAKGMVVR